ncbi:putative rna binding protein [Erysiphe neolycopersici]|uniref:Putative rna binding protein n=1 Tax=Erysiphe neolycopersici TaxID=212602 RepID=A0A420HCX3_9PEZI|nr:putative rna binding protein [Erysiphe neolycopersici]
MDRALDEIVAERYKGNRFQGRRSDHRPERKFYPRDGIRKAGCQFLLECSILLLIVHTPPILHSLYT